MLLEKYKNVSRSQIDPGLSVAADDLSSQHQPESNHTEILQPDPARHG